MSKREITMHELVEKYCNRGRVFAKADYPYRSEYVTILEADDVRVSGQSGRANPCKLHDR
jgi:hypothetical protein